MAICILCHGQGKTIDFHGQTDSNNNFPLVECVRCKGTGEEPVVEFDGWPDFFCPG